MVKELNERVVSPVLRVKSFNLFQSASCLGFFEYLNEKHPPIAGDHIEPTFFKNVAKTLLKNQSNGCRVEVG